MSQQAQQPLPLHFFETVSAFQRTSALKGAIDLDLFTAIAEGRTSIGELAAQCQASERGIRILCDYLVINGFLTKDGEHYGLTSDSAVFLDKRSPSYVGGATDFLLSPMLTEAFKDIAATVRKGGTIMPEEGSVTPDHPVWVQFARGMAPMMMMPAQLMSRFVGDDQKRKLKVLDIAAGHGMFGITIARAYPQAEIVALDWPNVLEVAKENAQKFGVSERHQLLPGNAFDVDFGTNYDLILLTNFLHHFDPPTCVKLLKKVHAALADGGRAFTLEFIPNDDRVSPPPSAAFSLVMLASTPSGDAYTFRELERMFAEAGFTRSELQELLPTPNRLVISYK